MGMRFPGLLSGAGGVDLWGCASQAYYRELEGWISGDALPRSIIGSWRGGLVGMRFPGLLSGAGGVD